MCSEVPPALSCPPASWVWRAAARIRGGGGGDAGREGGGRVGKGGGEDGAERRGGAAATGSPDCVSSPTGMSSSGEEDQAVHGSSAPPAAAAQTVAVPHTGLGNCRLRGAQCACAAPAVAVPPVLMLKLLLRLLPWWPPPGRGLSISPPARCPEVRGAGRANSITSSSHCQPRPRHLSCAFLLPLPQPTLLQQLDHHCPSEPNFCGAVRLVSAPLSLEIEANARRPVGPWSGRGSGRSRQDAGEGNGQSEGSHFSVSRWGPKPQTRPLGCKCSRFAEAEHGTRTDWAVHWTHSSHLTLLCPPPFLTASASKAQHGSFQHRSYPTRRGPSQIGSA